MAGPIGPLLPQPPGPDSDTTKAATAFLALALGVRLFPETLKPVGKFGLGLSVKPGTPNPVKVGPLALLNLLPQPFGFTPATTFGLAPNFYLPSTMENNLPGFIPGVNEQRAQVAAAKAAEEKAAADLRFKATPIVLENFGNEALIRIRDLALSADGPNRFTDPIAQAARINAELARREAERVANNAAIAARLAAANSGGVIVADSVGQLQQNLQPGGTGASTSPGAGFGLPGALGQLITNAGHEAGGNLPGNLPGPIGTPNAPAGTTDGPGAGWRRKRTTVPTSSFIDTLMEVFAGDP